jgi:hypothetical protein
MRYSRVLKSPESGLRFIMWLLCEYEERGQMHAFVRRLEILMKEMALRAS